MKSSILLIFLSFFVSFAISQNNTADRYLIYDQEKQLWGYMDHLGVLKIPPKYHNAGDFKNGLAPVREGGYYGYINVDGKTIIRPKFDYAESFVNETAIVYLGSKPYLIDLKGNIQFKHNYSAIEKSNSNFIVKTQTEKYGLINPKGKLLLDTCYSQISPFKEGLSVVISIQNKQEDAYEKLTGVIDETGKFVIPIGIYDVINGPENGFLEASNYLESKNKHVYFMLNKKGIIVYEEPDSVYVSNDYFSEGTMTIQITHSIPDSLKKLNRYSKDIEYAIIDTTGTVLYSCKDCQNITPVTCNRAFVEYQRGKWTLIDKKGNRIHSDNYKNIRFYRSRGNLSDLFVNGQTEVETTEGWMIIDTTGRIIGNVPKPLHKGQCVESSLLSLWRSYENKITVFRYFNQNDQLVKEYTIDYLTIHKNSDYMNQPRKQVPSTSYSHYNWGNSKNLPIADSLDLSMFVKTQLDTLSSGNVTELNVLTILNLSNDSLYFPVQDGLLYILLQAQNEHGEWLDIESISPSDCGHSYFYALLESNKSWEFTSITPVGMTPTQLRYCLYVNRSKNPRSLYSNEFKGSVNPGQFWR